MDPKSPSRGSRFGLVLDRASSVAALVSVAIMLWTGWNLAGRSQPERGGQTRPAPVVPTKPIALIDSQTRGIATAKVALVVFSDFECPVCERFAKEVLPEIEKDYVATGRVLLAFRNRPLEGIHEFAFGAAVAGFCAGKQDQFWGLHDTFFGDGPVKLDRQRVIDHSKRLTLNQKEFAQCLDSPQAAKAVRQEVDEADALEVQSTPTLLLATVTSNLVVQATNRWNGMPAAAVLRAAIDDLLRKVRG